MTLTYPRVALMIVGAQKAGTSSLFAYLGQHPGLRPARRREMSFFVDPDEYAKGYDVAYRFYFGECDDGTAPIAKLAGLMYQPPAIERLHEHNPDVALSVLLRNPVDRAYSAYLYARRRGYEDIEDFEEALDAGTERHRGDRLRAGVCAYVERSTYAPALRSLFDAFGEERVRVALLEDMKDDPVGLCQRLFETVGVDDSFVPGDLARQNTVAQPRWPAITRSLTSRNRLRGAVRSIVPRGTRDSMRTRIRRITEVETTPPPLSAETRHRVAERFRASNADLGCLIARDLSGWAS